MPSLQPHPIRKAKSKVDPTIRQKSRKILSKSANKPKTAQAKLGKSNLIQPEEPKLDEPSQNNEQQNSGVQDIRNEVLEIGTGTVESFEPMVFPFSTNSNSDTQIQAPEEIVPKSRKATYIKRLKDLRELEISHYRGDDLFTLKHNIEVPGHLIFSCDQKVKTKFHAVITLDNVSWLNITYWVQSYSHSKFRFGSPTIGLIPPKSKLEIKVRTRSCVRSFGDLKGETFMVLATPIFNPSLKKVSCLKVYWKVFGSDWFPVNMAESHCIDTLIPEEDSGDYSMIELMADFPSSRSKYNFETINPNEFYTAWEFYGGDWDTNYILDKQYLQYLKNTRVRRNKITKTDMFWATMIICFALMVCMYINQRIDEIGQGTGTVWYEYLMVKQWIKWVKNPFFW